MPHPAPEREKWLAWAIELQSIAQCGLSYPTSIYDTERYERLREIAAEMLSEQSEYPTQKVRELFCNETGYQTPKLDSRAAIFDEQGRILLVQENDGRWALPGGWVDVLESIGSNTIKEAREEAGLQIVNERLIAVQDRNRHNSPPYAYGVCKVFILCRRIGGQFQANSETQNSAYFTQEDIPPQLAEEKCTLAQIKLCFEAHANSQWQTRFD